MSNNIIKRTWKQGGLVNIEDLRGSAFQAEDGGHTFLISGVDENEDALALSGTPAGVLLRADGQDVTLTCSVSDGVVSATLPANAYVVPGRIGITIFLTNGGQKTAIYAAVGSVATTSSGIVAPPAGSDVVDLVDAIATAVATIPASYTDLMAAVAPTYSTSALYAVGSYAWYSGKLYRCTTAITSGETWTSAHWTQANLGSDVSDLKSALNALNVEILQYAEVNSPMSTPSGKDIDYIFTAGKVYTAKNDTQSTVNLFIRDATDQNIYTISSGLASGGTRTFTVPSDVTTGVKFRVYFNGQGIVSIYCNDALIPKNFADVNNAISKTIHYISSASAENANNYRNTGFYIINDNGLTNGFPDAGGVLIVYTGKDNHYQTYQVFVSYFDEKVYTRNEKGNGVWSDWIPSGAWVSSTTSETDLNNITDSGYYFISGTISNRPIADNGMLIVFKKESSPNYNTYQLFIDYTDHNLYIRGKQGSSTWSAWKCTEPTFVSKNIVWFGDSISSLKPLPDDTAAHISAKAISCAIPGARMDKATANNWKYEDVGFCNLMKCMNDNDYSSIDTAVAQFLEDDPTWAYESHMTAFKNLDWSKVDSAVVLYGTNDYWDGVVTIEQFKTDITTAFSQLITNHPLVRIYIITPMFRTDYATLNDQGVSLLAYVDAIKEVAQSLNIPCLDLFHESRINQYNATQYLNNDGLHQNTHGEKLLAQRIAKFIYGN